MNIYKKLIYDLKQKFNKDVNQYYFRISMQADLERVKKYGSSRVGISNNLWDKLDDYPKSLFPRYPIYHYDMIIASKWSDLESDVLLDNGTLKHKLSIYEKPFFTIYNNENLKEIGNENSKGEHNKGTHFLFLNSPLLALDSLWQINEENKLNDVNKENSTYSVKEIKWK